MIRYLKWCLWQRSMLVSAMEKFESDTQFSRLYTSVRIYNKKGIVTRQKLYCIDNARYSRYYNKQEHGVIGSTADFDSASLGSSPSAPATHEQQND